MGYIKKDDIESCVGNIVSRLKMKLESVIPSNETIRVLLVEGATDRLFIENKKDQSINCFSMGEILKVRSAFKDDDPQKAQNHKEAIMQTVYGLNVLPAIIECKGADKWKVYGIVDRDYEEFELYSRSKRLYVTDTHDLETLLISSDPQIWERLEDCEIKKQEIKEAFFLAYQLAIMRNAIKEYSGVTIKNIKSGSKEIDFSCFIDEDKVCLHKLIVYLNDKNKKESQGIVLSDNEIEKTEQKIVKDRNYKKLLTNDGLWKCSIDNFDINKIDNYWVIVDGHDVLAFLKYLNKSIKNKYQNTKGYSLDRGFEMDLIEHYDNEKFKSTILFKDLLKENVVIDY